MSPWRHVRYFHLNKKQIYFISWIANFGLGQACPWQHQSPGRGDFRPFRLRAKGDVSCGPSSQLFTHAWQYKVVLQLKILQAPWAIHVFLWHVLEEREVKLHCFSLYILCLHLCKPTCSQLPVHSWKKCTEIDLFYTASIGMPALCKAVTTNLMIQGVKANYVCCNCKRKTLT